MLKDMDSRGLLLRGENVSSNLADENLSDEQMLALLGVEEADNDVTKLIHVRSRDEIKAAEEIAKRTPCANFDEFKPVFQKVQRELEAGERKTVPFKGYADVKKGDLFILEGQKLIVVDLGERFVSDYDRPNRRLRVIYDNGTESDPLLRSFLRALYEDKASRRISDPGSGPLFSEIEEENDLATGYIYVLRSKSDHPYIVAYREVIHKIGLTVGDVKSRIAGAKKEPTYLLADVDIVAEYKLANVNLKALEALLHKIFGSARLDLELKDRFGGQVEPREWFLVSLAVIDEAIQKIKDGTIGDFRYDPETASLV